MAVLLTTASFTVRMLDAADPRIADTSLEDSRLGIYADADSAVALQYRTLNPYSTPPEIRWTIEVEPGPETAVRASLLLMTGRPLYEVDVSEPVTIVAVLPRNSEWGSTKSDVMPDGLNCASWYDGKKVRLAHPDLYTAFDESVVVTCPVPAVGKVQQLTFDLRFRYPDESRQDFGFGSTQSGLRMEGAYVPDAALSEAGLGFMLRQPSEVRLELPKGARLSEAFPEPTGGSAGTRAWRIGEGIVGNPDPAVIVQEDIVYRLESPQKRVWVQPTVDLSLLLAGVLFGLAPSLRRRPHA